MRAIMRTRGLDAWPDFASSWNDLGLDVHMADGGRYRRRQFAAFSVADSVAARKPINRIIRAATTIHLTAESSAGLCPWRIVWRPTAFTRGMLNICTTLFDAAAKPEVAISPWHVEMHQFRIEATPSGTGMPTPEGHIGTASIGYA